MGKAARRGPLCFSVLCLEKQPRGWASLDHPRGAVDSVPASPCTKEGLLALPSPVLPPLPPEANAKAENRFWKEMGLELEFEGRAA